MNAAEATPDTRSIVLCADDFGIAPGVNRGIVELLEEGRLSAVSCMVVYPEFRQAAPDLLRFAARANLGLHVTLTAERSLAGVMRDAYLHRLDPAAIEAEVARQVHVFREVMGCWPDYLDGHQHVHVLPVVRDVICAWAARTGAWVRNLEEPLLSVARRPCAFSSAVLSLMSRSIARRARRQGIATNQAFRGTWSFRQGVPYRPLFRAMIADAPEGCLVMCHPGWSDGVLVSRDRVTTVREEELAYLIGDEFLEDLAAQSLVLRRLTTGAARSTVMGAR